MTCLGEDITFECEVSKANVRATWTKDGMDILSDKKYDVAVNGGLHTLTVRSVDAIDVGDYAINVKGFRSNAQLEVEAKPELHVDDRYKTPT